MTQSSFRHFVFASEAKQSKATDGGLPRHCVPRKDGGGGLPRHCVPRNDGGRRLPRHCVPRNDGEIISWH